MTEPLWFETTISLPFPALDLWPFVADANRMDRAVGLPPATFSRQPRPEGGEEVTGEFSVMGVRTARWREYPFEWQRPHRYSVVREYDVGPITRLFGGAELTERDDGTNIRVFAEFTPRNRAVRAWVRLWLGPMTMRRARAQYEAFGDFLAGRTFDPLPALSPRPGDVDLDHLDACIARMYADDAPERPTQLLRRMLLNAADEDVSGMRPLELAKRWDVDPHDAVSAFLKATVAGLLEMRWEMMCPSCRGVKANAEHLRDLDATGYCSACNLPLGATVDEGIEARFYPARAARNVHVGVYCIGSPMNTPHRLAQTTLAANQSRDWALELDEGEYVIRSPQSKGFARMWASVDSDVRHAELTVDHDLVTPDELSVAPGDVTILVTNKTSNSATVAVDDAAWSTYGITPSRMMATSDAGAIFSGDALAAGIELTVGRVALLFSDLAGSTALYQRIGEARAFRLVTAHFSLIQDAVEHSHGAIVKTIGDAVMASFTEPQSAFEAALEIQSRMRLFDTEGAADSSQLVRIGVHVGPAYLVTLNDRLDYFGTTVNLAARAQREAAGGEIIITDNMFAEVAEHPMLGQVSTETIDVTLQGMLKSTRLHRIRLAPGPEE